MAPASLSAKICFLAENSSPPPFSQWSEWCWNVWSHFHVPGMGLSPKAFLSLDSSSCVQQCRKQEQSCSLGCHCQLYFKHHLQQDCWKLFTNWICTIHAGGWKGEVTSQTVSKKLVRNSTANACNQMTCMPQWEKYGTIFTNWQVGTQVEHNHTRFKFHTKDQTS